jgi:hypothetical protein
MNDWIIVNISHANVWLCQLGDLVHVADRRYASPDIDELAYTGLTSKEPHHSLEKRSISPRHVPDFGNCLKYGFRSIAVDQVVVLASKIVIIEASWVRPARIDLRRLETWLHHVFPLAADTTASSLALT